MQNQSELSKSKEVIAEIKISEFRKKVDELSYNKMLQSKVLKDILDKNLKKPKRATSENALQDIFKRKSYTKYQSIIITGMIDGRFSEKGSAWIHIVNENDKRVLTREFYRTDAKGLIDRLYPYAVVAKNICDGRPKGMDLILIPGSETQYGWRLKGSKKITPFNLNNYLYGLNKEEKHFIISNEKRRDRNLNKTKDIVKRQRTFQKTWK